mgnify:CR=1 FL=1
MLKEWEFGRDNRNKADCKALLKARREELAGLQLRLKEARLPVIVLLEGWGAAGKGSAIRSLIKELDPRFYKVLCVGMPTEEEQRWPFLKRHFASIPEEGKLLFLDSGWMDETVRLRLRGDLSDAEYARRLESINTFERQLTAGGYLLVKFFFHLDAESQLHRLQKLDRDKDTAWRVSENDWRQNKNYDRTLAAFDDYLEATGPAWAPWKILDGAQDSVKTQLDAADWLCRSIENALKSRPVPVQPERSWPLIAMPRLADVKLDKTVSEEKYEEQLKKYRERLAALHNELYRKKVPVVIVYEGWDAAGKGGNIKRVAQALDARAYTIFPSPAPTKPELAHPFLWRYWTRLPKAGHVGMYDRSWYGRVLVERVEGFATPAEWSRAYDEINEFERELVRWGAILLKFWVDVSPEEQLRRFQDREDDPAKQWKITKDDWRNREKYPQYKAAIDDMFRLTSTTFAPWIVLESDDKRYARIKALRIIVEALEKRLGECPAS